MAEQTPQHPDNLSPHDKRLAALHEVVMGMKNILNKDMYEVTVPLDMTNELMNNPLEYIQVLSRQVYVEAKASTVLDTLRRVRSRILKKEGGDIELGPDFRDYTISAPSAHQEEFLTLCEDSVARGTHDGISLLISSLTRPVMPQGTPFPHPAEGTQISLPTCIPDVSVVMEVVQTEGERTTTRSFYARHLTVDS